jgi:hypothetical protein
MTPRRKPRMLRNIKIAEVSSVDKGAGEGVRIMLLKRDQDTRVVRAIGVVAKDICEANISDTEKLRAIGQCAYDAAKFVTTLHDRPELVGHMGDLAAAREKPQPVETMGEATPRARPREGNMPNVDVNNFKRWDAYTDLISVRDKCTKAAAILKAMHEPVGQELFTLAKAVMGNGADALGNTASGSHGAGNTPGSDADGANALSRLREQHDGKPADNYDDLVAAFVQRGHSLSEAHSRAIAARPDLWKVKKNATRPVETIHGTVMATY